MCIADTKRGVGSNATTAAGAARAKREGGTARDPQMMSTRGGGPAASGNNRRREVVSSEDPPALIGTAAAVDPHPDLAEISAQGDTSSWRGQRSEPQKQGQQTEAQRQVQQPGRLQQGQHVSVPVGDWPDLLRLQASQHRAARRGYLRRRVSELVLAKVSVGGWLGAASRGGLRSLCWHRLVVGGTLLCGRAAGQPWPSHHLAHLLTHFLRTPFPPRPRPSHL